MNAALRRVACHGAQIAMHHRLAADEKQIADVIFQRNVHHAFRLVERHAPARLGIKLRAGEAAKVAVGIADVGDGELQVARAAVVQHFLEKGERGFFLANHRRGKIYGRGR